MPQPPVDPAAGKTLGGAATTKAGTLEIDDGEPGAAGETLSDSSVCDRGAECEGVPTWYDEILAAYKEAKARYYEERARYYEERAQYNEDKAQYNGDRVQRDEILAAYNEAIHQQNELKAGQNKLKAQDEEFKAQYKELKAQYEGLKAQFNAYHNDALDRCRCVECDEVGNEELRVFGEKLWTMEETLRASGGQLRSSEPNLQTTEEVLGALENYN